MPRCQKATHSALDAMKWRVYAHSLIFFTNILLCLRCLICSVHCSPQGSLDMVLFLKPGHDIIMIIMFSVNLNYGRFGSMSCLLLIYDAKM